MDEMRVRTSASAATVVVVTTALGFAQAPTPAPPDFGRDVMPILETNCLRCHNTAKQEGGLLLESFDDLMKVKGNEPPLAGYTIDDAFRWCVDSIPRVPAARHDCSGQDLLRRRRMVHTRPGL